MTLGFANSNQQPSVQVWENWLEWEGDGCTMTKHARVQFLLFDSTQLDSLKLVASWFVVSTMLNCLRKHSFCATMMSKHCWPLNPQQVIRNWAMSLVLQSSCLHSKILCKMILGHVANHHGPAGPDCFLKLSCHLFSCQQLRKDVKWNVKSKTETWSLLFQSVAYLAASCLKDDLLMASFEWKTEDAHDPMPGNRIQTQNIERRANPEEKDSSKNMTLCSSACLFTPLPVEWVAALQGSFNERHSKERWNARQTNHCKNKRSWSLATTTRRRIWLTKIIYLGSTTPLVTLQQEVTITDQWWLIASQTSKKQNAFRMKRPTSPLWFLWSTRTLEDPIVNYLVGFVKKLLSKEGKILTIVQFICKIRNVLKGRWKNSTHRRDW